MIELLANLSFPLESIVEDDIALRFGMRDFDGDLSSGARVCGAEDGRHSTTRHKFLQTILVELVPHIEWSHCQRHPLAKLHDRRGFIKIA